MRIVESIEHDEGWRSRMYTDTTGHRTIGFGFNLKAVELPKPVGMLWLAFLIDKYEKELKASYDWYDGLDEDRQDAILNMYYNLGSNGFSKFKKMIKALENKHYPDAAAEMLSSKWADQVGQRAVRLSEIMAGI